MKERPILFSAPMVRALLAGTKTQTRRILKLKPGFDLEERADGTVWPWAEHPDRCDDVWMSCPYGQPGDRLWVRETWCRKWDDERGFLDECWYRASNPDVVSVDAMEKSPWKPSIHMPRWASRILLDVKAVRVERLQDISEADACAEGVHTDPACPAYDAYQALWNDINGPGSWDANPWVWVVEFERAQGQQKGQTP